MHGYLSARWYSELAPHLTGDSTRQTKYFSWCSLVEWLRDPATIWSALAAVLAEERTDTR